MPFKCKFCGKKFCSEHRLPENHNCEDMTTYFEQQRNKKIVYDAVQEEKEYREKHSSSNKGKIKGFFNKIKRKFKNFLNPPKKINRSYGGPRNRGPFSDALNSSFPDKANVIILGIILVGYLLQMVVPGFTGMFNLDPTVAYSQPWRFLTTIFLHGHPGHLIINSLVLFMFGSILERKVGTKRYLKIFFVSGILASLSFVIFMNFRGATTPAVGASGAIFGIFAALAILAPEIRVLFFFLFPMGIRTALVIFAAYDLINLFLYAETSLTASIAHLTGLVIGVYYGYKIRKNGKYNKRTSFI